MAPERPVVPVPRACRDKDICCLGHTVLSPFVLSDYVAVLRQQRWQDACVLTDTAKQIEKEADLSSLLREGNKGKQLKKLYDYDTFIAESDRIYRQWWIMWKRIHSGWALYVAQ